MGRWWYLVVLVVYSSCNYFVSTEKRTQAIVDEELMAIDWNDVEQLPLFEECDELAPKEEQMHCFQLQMLNQLSEATQDLVLTSSKNVNDTILIDFEVDEDGFINIVSMDNVQAIEAAIPNFRNEIRSRFKDLTVVPAHERGVNVKIKFRLPLALNTE